MKQAMKRTKTRTLIGAGAVAGATLLFAMSGATAPHFFSGPGGPGGPDRARHLMQSLDLSEAQRSAVEAKFEETSQAMQADRERMRELRQEAHLLLDDFDEGRAQQLADEIGQITARMAYARMARHADLYALLDEEQRAALDAKLKQHKAWRKGWREGRRARDM